MRVYTICIFENNINILITIMHYFFKKKMYADDVKVILFNQ